MIKEFINCNSVGVIYAIKCNCNKIYIGSTKRMLKVRIQEHKRAVVNHDLKSPIYQHIRDNHNGQTDFKFHGLQRIIPRTRGGDWELMIRKQEARWISRCRTVSQGLNRDNEFHHFL